ncbi:hypothetical protein [Streptomyces sp. NBC_01803]|uniref:hypothetical protein n=1 Tax=Streptomyces sp. NBC_01803 TaxID=2975946 RepID=UPI002DD7BD2B|nr:hypothetical protein [Streptomyces sp. NBC_01803]WSA44724.1 hypothetical protein OIE51_11230 [Streptomyces sp. NBC_01803]
MTDITTKPDLAEIQIVDHHPTSEPATGLTSPPVRPEDRVTEAPETEVETEPEGAEVAEGDTAEVDTAKGGKAAAKPVPITRPKPGRRNVVTTDHHPTGAPAAGAAVPVRPTDTDGPTGGDAA